MLEKNLIEEAPPPERRISKSVSLVLEDFHNSTLGLLENRWPPAT